MNEIAMRLHASADGSGSGGGGGGDDVSGYGNNGRDEGERKNRKCVIVINKL